MNEQKELTLGLLLILGVVSFGLVSGGGLLGSSGAEVYGHAWVQWWHGEALWAWPSGTSSALGVEQWAVIDPIPTAMGAIVGRLLGWSVGWNTVIILAVACAFLGGAFLSKRAGGSAIVGGVVLSLAPIFMGSLASGLTEDAALGLIAFSFGLIFYPTGNRDSIAGGFLLGLIAWCGLYLAWMAAVSALILSLFQIRANWRRLLLSGAVALLLAVPAAYQHGERVSGQGHRAGVHHQVEYEPLWQINPWAQADLASFGTPSLEDNTEGALVRFHPAYVGWTTLLLAVLSGRRRWWLIFGGAIFFAIGESPTFAGRPIGVENPIFWLMNKIPYASLLNHHARLMLVGQLALAVTASIGALRIYKSRSIKPWHMAVVIALEIVVCSPAPLPLPVTNNQIEEIFYEAADGTGGVLTIPMAGPGVHPQRSLYEARAHGRQVMQNPNRPGPTEAMLADPFGLWLSSLGFPHHPDAPDDLSFEPMRSAGVEAIIVRENLVMEVESAIGPPDIRSNGGALWRLSRLSSIEGESSR